MIKTSNYYLFQCSKGLIITDLNYNELSIIETKIKNGLIETLDLLNDSVVVLADSKNKKLELINF